ncbi:hypothetical protein ACFL4T_10435 [candidate division KSB1 bacterium]
MKKMNCKIALYLTLLLLLALNCENREVTKSNNNHGGDITATLTYENVFLEGETLFSSYVEARFDSLSVPIEIDVAYFNDIFLQKYGHSYVLTNILQYFFVDFEEEYNWAVYGEPYFDSLSIVINAPSNSPVLIQPDTNVIDLNEHLEIIWEKPERYYDNRLLVTFSGPSFATFGFYLRDNDGQATIGKQILQQIHGNMAILSLTRYNSLNIGSDIFSEQSVVRVGITAAYQMTPINVNISSGND